MYDKTKDTKEENEENGEQYADPLAELDGETVVNIECGVARETISECDGWSKTIDLDEPVNYANGKIELPGFRWECPECGNPNEFVVEGIRVSNLV